MGIVRAKIYDTEVEVYHEDCIEAMNRMHSDGETVDLTVCSPPYDDLRSYNKSSQWNFDIFKKVAQGLWNITSEGGVVVWIVGDGCADGTESGTSFKQALYFKELGFKLHDTMIYEKNSSSFPARKGGNRYTQIFEYMFVFCKGKIHKCKLLCDKPNKWAGYTNWGSNTQYNKEGELVHTKDIKIVPQFSPRNNIWKYTTGFNDKRYKHPAMFPLQLAVDHILSWSDEGMTIFDPFLGSGTTMAAAIKTNRAKFVGCEIDNEYYYTIIRRINDYGMFLEAENPKSSAQNPISSKEE